MISTPPFLRGQLLTSAAPATHCTDTCVLLPLNLYRARGHQLGQPATQGSLPAPNVATICQAMISVRSVLTDLNLRGHTICRLAAQSPLSQNAFDHMPGKRCQG